MNSDDELIDDENLPWHDALSDGVQPGDIPFPTPAKPTTRAPDPVSSIPLDLLVVRRESLSSKFNL
mgnify:CR=1 FL=1